MDIRGQRVYKLKRVAGPGNFFGDSYSVHVSGVYVLKNKILFKDNVCLLEKEFYIDIIFKKILIDYYGNFYPLIGGFNILCMRVISLIVDSSERGLDNFNICNTHIEELVDELRKSETL